MVKDIGPPASGVVGPNAVIQLGNALERRHGRAAVLDVFSRGGYPDLVDHPPDKMVNEDVAAALMASLFEVMKPAEAGAIVCEAGRMTADYVIAHRIPRAARWLLAGAPAPQAARLLLKSIHRNAWTFCGSGVCIIETGRTPALTLINNPIRTPDCAWHTAVLQQLFKQLVSARLRIDYCAVRLDGNPADRFDVVRVRHKSGIAPGRARQKAQTSFGHPD